MYVARTDNTFADSKPPNLIYQYKAYYQANLTTNVKENYQLSERTVSFNLSEIFSAFSI